LSEVESRCNLVFLAICQRGRRSAESAVIEWRRGLHNGAYANAISVAALNEHRFVKKAHEIQGRFRCKNQAQKESGFRVTLYVQP
jgi:hypothetical protein